MKLDPVLMEILVCPDCKGELRADEANDELVCLRCGLIYPVRDDIPVMLVEEARREDTPAPPTAPPTDEEPGAAGEDA